MLDASVKSPATLCGQMVEPGAATSHVQRSTTTSGLPLRMRISLSGPSPWPSAPIAKTATAWDGSAFKRQYKLPVSLAPATRRPSRLADTALEVSVSSVCSPSPSVETCWQASLVRLPLGGNLWQPHR
jgi:hypothetical protein